MQDLFTKSNIKIWNSKPSRDFIFVEDAADAVLKLLNVDYCGPINLGTGNSVSIKEIINIIKDLSGKDIVDENKKVTGPMKFSTDISLLKNLTGWKPKFDIKTGITKTYSIMKRFYK